MRSCLCLKLLTGSQAGSPGQHVPLAPSSEVSGFGGGIEMNHLGGPEESGSPGGFIPINTNGNSNTNSESSAGQAGNPGLSDVTSCHGLVQVYTQWCRKNCLAGNCSVWLCSRDCFRLLG
ncbi:hypothetical protein ElyMa_004184700 [Elysia marginata]|uniref:Uncharacterized protein n=1 Tax=Elysia marginata TaxID=1093978 RepID=A0AAV4GK52_9GAST|nr:hypothetical protein ElyMa_004184700 [Elysia marginata]